VRTKSTNGVRGSIPRRRPLTIGRVLLINKTFEIGGALPAILAFRDAHGISIKKSTYYCWLNGFRVPHGNPAVSECGTFLNPPTRGYVNEWLGITDDSWWWTLVDSKHLEHKEPPDPFVMLGLRPPEEP